MTGVQKWVGTSCKMHKTLVQALHFADALVEADIENDPAIQRFVIPAFTTARQVKDILADTSVLVGAQNMHWEDDGPWTGEISPPMLVDCGLDIVEIGHSERRAHFGETDHRVGLKAEAAVRHGLTPLICVGETLQERDAGQARQKLEAQVRGALGALNAAQKTQRILFAYEPVWAIGVNGHPATPEYADDRQAEIIKLASDILGQKTPCLYGGSVNPENCTALIRCPNIDGLFIGRSAWKVEGYLDILARCSAPA